MSQGTHGQHDAPHAHDAGHGPPGHLAHAEPGAHGAHGAHGGAHSHGPTRSTFITIWLLLGFLTVVEVMVPQVYSAPWNRNIKMLLLVGLAIGKALLVALYFMHLKWERPWLKYIALMPAYMGFAAVVLMIEEAWRGSLS